MKMKKNDDTYYNINEETKEAYIFKLHFTANHVTLINYH